jgi:hypothetical protein
VRLAYAVAQAFSPSGAISVAYTGITVRVDNLAYTKDVVLHYRAGSGQWQQLTLPWTESRGDHDIFSSDQLNIREVLPEFAISYTVNGYTYWDSDFGQNYHLGSLNTVVGGNVALAWARTEVTGQGAPQVRGEIHVNNLSSIKMVGIRYSVDGGSTWHDTPANYVGPATEGVGAANLGVVELWRFQTPGITAVPTPVRFAVYYLDLPRNEYYWDNNFGHDYRLSSAPNSDVR